MFHKITFCLNEKTFEKNKIIELFENVVFEKKKKKMESSSYK